MSISNTKNLANGRLHGNEITITYRSITELTLNPNNPRIHTPKQIHQLARSIATFGFTVPILVTGQDQVIAGHGRLLAAKELGIIHVPTICLEHLTERQIQAYVIADNKLAENATWNEKLLAEQFKALSLVKLDFSLEITGFDMGEIDLLIEGLSPLTDDDGDPADALPNDLSEHVVTHPGDLWILDNHRIYCGSALDAEAYAVLMNSKQASMIFTDPPYNVPIEGHASGLGSFHHKEFVMACGEMDPDTFTQFLTNALTNLAHHSAPGSLHYVCMDWRHIGELYAAGQTVYTELKNLCIWVKDNGGMGSLYRSQHELIFVFKNGTASHQNHVQLGQFGRYRSNVWNYPGVNSFGRTTEEGNLLALHPTIKPVALVADAILDCSSRGDIVLDAFLGSGSTVMAGERTGRICYGIEIDPVYVDTAIRRWQTYTGQTAVHSESGQTFNGLEAERKCAHG